MHLIKCAALAILGLGVSTPATASYLYDFHFNALGNYAATDIVYSADTLRAPVLTYVSGSVNGYISSTAEDFNFTIGGQFDGYSPAVPDFTKPSGAVADFYFRPDGSDAVLTSPGVYQSTNRAGRGISNGAGSTIEQYTSGYLTITPFPALPELSTWICMIAGFGLVGATLRRNKKPYPSAARATA